MRPLHRERTGKTDSMTFKGINKVYFLGIGGIGMSAWRDGSDMKAIL